MPPGVLNSFMDDFQRRGLPDDLDTLTLRRVMELWIYHDIELVLGSGAG